MKMSYKISTQSNLPAFYHTTNGLPSHLMSTLTNTLKRAKLNIYNILKSIEPDLIIYDVVLQMWTAGLASTLNIPAVKFTTSSVAAFSYIFHKFINPGQEFPFPAIYVSDIEQARILRDLKTASKVEAEDNSTDHHPGDDDQEVPKRFCDSIVIVRSCREIEGKYMKYLSDMTMMKVVSVGPLFQDPGENQDEKNDELIQWLGGKSECSSVFVSFGSEYFLTKEDMEEIAFGLELSNVNFIWVVRFPVGEKMRPEEALPEGFLERVKERGRIVEGWAPQAKILRHPSIGGFVCHCGWSSVLESIELGVPIIAIPMNLHQPFNARLVVEVGAAVEVVKGENQRLERDAIAQLIKDVVIGNVGNDLRRNVRDLSQKMQSSEKEELDESVELLAQLCGKK